MDFTPVVSGADMGRQNVLLGVMLGNNTRQQIALGGG